MSQSPLHCWWTCLVYSSPDPNQKEQQTGSHLGGERAMNQRADLRTPAGRARGAPLHALWWPGQEKAPEREDMYTQSWFTLPCSRDSHHCKATILQYTPIKVIKKKKSTFTTWGKGLASSMTLAAASLTIQEFCFKQSPQGNACPCLPT